MNLMEAYDYAQQDEQMHGWVRFCGAHLGVEVKENGLVYVWNVENTDTDNQFDTEELSVKQFMNAVEHFVHDEMSPELAQ